MIAKIFFLIGMMMIVTAFVAVPVITESGLAFACWMAGGLVMGCLAGMLEATEK